MVSKGVPVDELPYMKSQTSRAVSRLCRKETIEALLGKDMVEVILGGWRAWENNSEVSPSWRSPSRCYSAHGSTCRLDFAHDFGRKVACFVHHVHCLECRPGDFQVEIQRATR
jgi:hypothetical protein